MKSITVSFSREQYVELTLRADIKHLTVDKYLHWLMCEASDEVVEYEKNLITKEMVDKYIKENKKNGENKSLRHRNK